MVTVTEDDDIILARDDFDALKALHAYLNIPALSLNVATVICDEELEVADQLPQHDSGSDVGEDDDIADEVRSEEDEDEEEAVAELRREMAEAKISTPRSRPGSADRIVRLSSRPLVTSASWKSTAKPPRGLDAKAAGRDGAPRGGAAAQAKSGQRAAEFKRSFKTYKQ